MNPLLLLALLLVLCALLLVVIRVREHVSNRQVLQRLQQAEGYSAGNWRREFQHSALARRTRQIDGETLLLLDRLGWRRSRQRMLFYIAQYTLPLVLLLITLVWQRFNEPGDTPWIAPLAALGVGYLIPKRWLARAAAQRQLALAEEVPTLIPLLRMLFEVGMTVEQALRVLARDGREILPELTFELRLLLQRVDAGMALPQELRRTVGLVEVDAVTDCFGILEQLVGQGGGAMASLLALKELLDDRRMTTLQERVSKLSAKMSVVMISFLFPALLIVLAGPGFIAIFKALGGI